MERLPYWNHRSVEIEGYECYSLELSNEKMVTLGYSELEEILITLFERRNRNKVRIAYAIGMNSDGIVYYNGSNLEDLSDLKEIIKNAKGLPEDKNKVICKLLDMVNPLN